jgi:hypothetical protein
MVPSHPHADPNPNGDTNRDLDPHAYADRDGDSGAVRNADEYGNRHADLHGDAGTLGYVYAYGNGDARTGEHGDGNPDPHADRNGDDHKYAHDGALTLEAADCAVLTRPQVCFQSVLLTRTYTREYE